MKAIRIHEDGGPDVLRYEDVPDPEPGEGEVLIELRAASLNHLDVWIRRGLPSVPKPRILGADGAGVIAGTDERVVINPGIVSNGKTQIVGETMDGTHCELIALPRDTVHPIPEGVSFEEAAAFPLVFETAYRMLVTRARLQPGEWVLIWGIGGGVATAAMSIANFRWQRPAPLMNGSRRASSSARSCSRFPADHFSRRGSSATGRAQDGT